MTDIKFYTTTDYHITAMLVMQKFKILQVKSEGNKNRVKRFFFEDTFELREAIMSFMNGEMEGNLREYRNAQEVVKDLLYNG